MKRLVSKAGNPKVSIVFHLEKDYLHAHESVCNLHTLLPPTHTLLTEAVC